MHIDELRALFGLTRKTIHEWSYRGLIPPHNGCRKYATYDNRHVEAIRAIRALQDLSPHLTDLGPFLKEEGITIQQYVAQREQSLREHGLGIG